MWTFALCHGSHSPSRQIHSDSAIFAMGSFEWRRADDRTFVSLETKLKPEPRTDDAPREMYRYSANLRRPPRVQRTTTLGNGVVLCPPSTAR